MCSVPPSFNAALPPPPFSALRFLLFVAPDLLLLGTSGACSHQPRVLFLCCAHYPDTQSPHSCRPEDVTCVACRSVLLPMLCPSPLVFLSPPRLPPHFASHAPRRTPPVCAECVAPSWHSFLATLPCTAPRLYSCSPVPFSSGSTPLALHPRSGLLASTLLSTFLFRPRSHRRSPVPTRHFISSVRSHSRTTLVLPGLLSASPCLCLLLHSLLLISTLFFRCFRSESASLPPMPSFTVPFCCFPSCSSYLAHFLVPQIASGLTPIESTSVLPLQHPHFLQSLLTAPLEASTLLCISIGLPSALQQDCFRPSRRSICSLLRFAFIRACLSCIFLSPPLSSRALLFQAPFSRRLTVLNSFLAARVCWQRYSRLLRPNFPSLTPLTHTSYTLHDHLFRFSAQRLSALSFPHRTSDKLLSVCSTFTRAFPNSHSLGTPTSQPSPRLATPLLQGTLPLPAIDFGLSTPSGLHHLPPAARSSAHS